LRQDRGIALLITLWVMVLLSVVAMNLLLSTRFGNASARNFKEETLAYYSALSAYEEAAGYLLSDKDLSVDFKDEEGIFRTDTERPPVSGEKFYGTMTVQIDISDEESRLNINTIGEPVVKSLFEHAGIPEDSIPELMDSLSDWKDPDDLHRLSGAESDYYEDLDVPYQAKNRPLDMPEELLLIKGFKPGYLYGAEDIAGISSLITTTGLGVNINTAPAEVLVLSGMDPALVEAIMTLRTKEAGGMRVTPPSSSGVAFSTASWTFRIEVKAGIPESGRTVKITAAVRRVSGLKGLELKTLYWKESIESGGA